MTQQVGVLLSAEKFLSDRDTTLLRYAANREEGKKLMGKLPLFYSQGNLNKKSDSLLLGQLWAKGEGLPVLRVEPDEIVAHYKV